MALSIMFWVNYTRDKLKLMRKSETAVNSDHVLKFLFDRECLHVSAVVQASMRDRSYKVEVHLNDAFGVTYSSLRCPLGQYSCHHVAAALLFGYRRATKTDVKCSWLNAPKSKIRPEIATMEELFPLAKPNYK
ncbi:LOW QUALITY PROTEIN: uncharacterized protein LOC124268351 [Haliotis rubra]|uniref:LOW QUALITY PROTEIN: uncharacterized protein LOC124268351 n=1 Tax=Haliotis rubra TaxID=36100 RepID=UPI001EE5C964|nr:LOW QUALITY PROTEIN: uncharacterized protein LOC124268351 [Haliotis rubra]